MTKSNWVLRLAVSFCRIHKFPEKHSIRVANVEKHFKALHEIWMDEGLVNFHYQESIGEHHQVMGNIEAFALTTLNGVHHSQVKRVRSDPSLNSILDETDPAVRMRGAISILIRYWSMEYKLEEYFFRDIGLYALRLDISFDDTKDDAAVAQASSIIALK
ncbi:hypothetical protein PHJA_002515200 [Phtheirospermum japonicum]|uniref:Uncharacterized protein n=1 Tax=Phtheirospermum japonicum TaxID=374723 RepID=A0A830D642_9LAMI|nr:hypothetical protein PHJA_002515200 [Phtheirospermum japonicum]